MTKLTFAIALLVACLPQLASAQPTGPTSIGGYCKVVEQQIVVLADMAASANMDLAKFAADRPTADPTKFAKANKSLASAGQSLKETENEWYRLGCVQILYPRPTSN